MHGKGIYTWKDGRKYEGDYTMDKKHGQGVYTWADGRRYDGQWQNGKQHGEGVYYDVSGAAKKGIWENGKRAKWLDDDEAAPSSTDGNKIVQSESDANANS